MKRPEHFPDFFLIGAPRCGTTALSHYLRRNPSVCFSDPKETFFFGRPLPERGAGDLQSAYVDRYFSHHDPARHRAMGEGTVSYLYDREALERILAIRPDARFLVMVRNPLEMIPSYHLRMLYVLEEEESLERAWALQEARARGEHLPRNCKDPRVLQYADVGMLGRHLEALFALGGRERCHVVVYDDFHSRTREVYRAVLEFIGAEDDGREHFMPLQTSKTFRSRWLQQLVFKPPGFLVKDPDALRLGDKRLPGALKRLRKKLLRRNKVLTVRPSLSAEMADTIRRTFADDVRRLGELLGRDLSHWLGDATTGPRLASRRGASAALG